MSNMLELVYLCEGVKTHTSRILCNFQGKKFPKLNIVKSADETEWMIKKLGKINMLLCYSDTHQQIQALYWF